MQADAGGRRRSPGDARTAHYERYVVDLLEGSEIVGVHPVGPDVFPVIGADDHDRVLQLAGAADLVQKSSQLAVDFRYAGKIAGHGLAPLAGGYAP